VRILYSAIDQAVPGAHGGAVHVASVADGLASLGHEVHVLATPGRDPFPSGPVRWVGIAPPLGARQLRLFRAAQVLGVARSLGPDAVIERYYNFGGEGILAARRVDAVAVLEVNSPVIDYPGSPKRWLDALLLIQPMRRWRVWQCRAADLIVTPSPEILPPGLPAERVLQIEWGADTERFRPGAAGTVPFSRGPSDTVAIFVGAFRAWHGAIHLVEAIRQLRARGRTDVKAVLIGDGPELPRVRRAAAGVSGITLTGSLPHQQIPACLAAADVGVAPFDTTSHAALAQEFYWSPLKVFEYMASGLPVVAPRLGRLSGIVRDGQEGVLYDASDPAGLAAALEALSGPVRRSELGVRARDRVVREFSWQRHCERLGEAIQAARDRRARPGTPCAS
jgi:glycosyltransferase involved in cell wall biosynthesis